MQLPVSVTLLNLKGSPSLDRYIRAEAAKLVSFFSPILSCRVIVEQPSQAPDEVSCVVRVELETPDVELVARHGPRPHLEEAPGTNRAKATRQRAALRQTIHEAFLEMGGRLQNYARRRDEPMLRTQVTKLFHDSGYGVLETLDYRAGGQAEETDPNIRHIKQPLGEATRPVVADSKKRRIRTGTRT